MDEFAKSSGLFDHYKALQLLKLSPGADFDGHLSRFTTLIRAIQREKGSIDDRETAAHWYNSLDERGQDDIDRAPAQDVKTFVQMRERSRGFYRSLKKTWKANAAGKSITTNVATAAGPATTTQAHQPLPTQPASTRPKPSTFWDTTAQRPADGVTDGSIFNLDFIRKFRCQRCLCHDHSTGSCKQSKMAFESLRCARCGTHHDPVRFPEAHCRDSNCYRCGKRGHMSRACPEPLPQKPDTTPSSSTGTEGAKIQANVVQITDSDGSGLPMIKLAISSPDYDSPKPEGRVATNALLDSGAEQPLCAEDEYNRWCDAGLVLPLVPDPRTIIFGNPSHQSSTLGRAS
ncbi:hypothetical protein Pmar_PMAR017808, partial [Perkinsus marinus ATCC 50983]